jgi:uncharacterized protein YbaR (Trm112 family)
VLLELTEVLRCPRDHEESFVVCVSYAAEGRHVVRGIVGCPHCHAEFPIRDGVLDYSEGTEGTGGTEGTKGTEGGGTLRPYDHTPVRPHDGPLTPEALATFLDLRGPGGYVVLVGAAGRLAAGLTALAPGVHVVVVDGPPGERAPECSYVSCRDRIPLKASQARAVVLGADRAAAPWPTEASRVLLRGLRVVVEDERASPEGISELARGAGVFVGTKTGR